MGEHSGAGDLQRRVRSVGRPLVTRMWNIERTGYDRLPTAGPAILCPNHISFIDSMFLMFTVPRNISFVGKAEYMDSWKTKYLFPALGMIPIDRSGGSKSMAALEAAAGVLRRGELFGIFPEGTRSRDGQLREGRLGAALLAMRSGVPVLPVGIAGSQRIFPGRSRWPHRSLVTFTIGDTFQLPRIEAVDRGALKEGTERIMHEIAALLPPEQQGRWGAGTDDVTSNAGTAT
jgi:1-acyl-sn-glycerol-3-phosphate acyltransferase